MTLGFSYNEQAFRFNEREGTDATRFWTALKGVMARLEAVREFLERNHGLSVSAYKDAVNVQRQRHKDAQKAWLKKAEDRLNVARLNQLLKDFEGTKQ